MDLIISVLVAIEVSTFLFFIFALVPLSVLYACVVLITKIRDKL